jgi:hypothetical protein
MALTDNIIAYWKLDGNSNDAVGSNNGTDTDITYSSGNGKINQGAGFNGSSSKIVGSSVNIGTNATIACWFKSSAGSGTYPCIFEFLSAGGAVFSITQNVSTGKVYSALIDSDSVVLVSNGDDNIKDGNWHHVVAVKSGGNLKIYVDNVENDSQSATFTGNFNSMVMRMGLDTGEGTYFQGAVDECAYWDKALNTTEISQLYNSGNGLQYPFTTAYTADLQTGTFTLTGIDVNIDKGVHYVANIVVGAFTLVGMNIIASVRGWLFKNKNTTEWTNKSKNTTEWTNKSKNSSSWTYKTRN